MKILDVDNDTSLKMEDFIRFAGASGFVGVPIIDVKTGTVKMVPCFTSILVGTNHTDKQINDFLEPASDETLLRIPSNWRMPQVMKMLGCFPSATQAKNNGWDRAIPSGWSEIRIKHSRIKGTVCFLNIDQSTFVWEIDE